MLNLLVADDESTFIRFVGAVVREYDLPFTVVSAGSGREAVDIAATSRPDVALLDIRMPGTSGLDAGRWIKSACPGCRVLMLTAYAEFEFARRALRFGAEDYLLKPIRPVDLCLSLMGVWLQLRYPPGLAGLPGPSGRPSGQPHTGSPYVVAAFKPENDRVVLSEFHTEIKHLLCSAGMLLGYALIDNTLIAIYRENRPDGASSRDMAGILRGLSPRLSQATGCRFRMGTSGPEVTDPDEAYRQAMFSIEIAEFWGFFDVQFDRSMMSPGEDLLSRLRGEMRKAASDPDSSAGQAACQAMRRCLEDHGMVHPDLLRDMARDILASNGIPLAGCPGSDPGASRSIGDLLSRLSRSLEAPFYRKAVGATSAEQIVEKAALYLKAHLAGRPSLGDAARQACVSRFYLSRLFKQVKGMSFIEYLTALRIDHAQELLALGYPVHYVSRKVGFRDTSYFARVFQKRVGVTPGVVAARCRGKRSPVLEGRVPNDE